MILLFILIIPILIYALWFTISIISIEEQDKEIKEQRKEIFTNIIKINKYLANKKNSN